MASRYGPLDRKSWTQSQRIRGKLAFRYGASYVKNNGKSSARKISKNPGGQTRTRTVTLQQFWNEAVRTRNKPLCAEIQKKFGGYEKWTHGTKATKVKLEWIRHPTLRGTTVTYDGGRQPEALYKMGNGHKRESSLWKHKWETAPTLHHDPEAGLIITKLRGKSKITDFLHG